MRNALKKGLLAIITSLIASVLWAVDVTFTMSSIFDGNNLTASVTDPTAATISTTTSKGNAKEGKLGSDGNYFQIILSTETFSAVKIHGYINAGDQSKKWGFQFSTDGGQTWGSELSQANDGNKNPHDINVTVTIPQKANGFRVIRRAGSATVVESITFTLEAAGPTCTDPAATFTATPTSVYVGDNVTLAFTSQNTSQVTYDIKENNAANTHGTLSSDKKTFSATQEGIYVITATQPATEPYCAVEKNVTITINAKTPVTTVSVNGPNTGKVGQALTYTATAQNATEYQWFVNNQVQTETTNSFVFTPAATGTYSIACKARNSFNDANTYISSTPVSVSVTEADPVPSTDLTIHMPEVYEAETMYGGYGGTLKVVNGHEYEVFYINRDNDENLSLATTNVDKANSITIGIDKQKTATSDGWCKVTTTSNSGGDANAAASDEFAQSIRSVSMKETDEVILHVKGYDQFSFYGKDNGTNNDKYFHVYIDDLPQTMQPNTNYAIRRFSMTAGEHVIRVTIKNGVTSSSKFNAFSLRLAQEPRTKWMYGNDSTQNILQTEAPSAIYYFTKYNNKGETKLEWDGAEATGITLAPAGSGELGDTLKLSGIANCPVGLYKYNVVSYYNNLETNRASGKFNVISDIQALTDTVIDAYKNASIDLIKFRCYVLGENDITFTWANNRPAGVNTSFENGVFTINGKPTATGNFKYTISVAGKSLTGEIRVKELDLSGNPIMFLYKNTLAYDKDGVYKYLNANGKKLITWKTGDDLRSEGYTAYKLIIISEDVDADNEEVLKIINGQAAVPVLNMKGFTYAKGRANLGNPDNGSVATEGCNVYIQQPSHPIFNKFSGKQTGDAIKVLSTIDRKGLMPIDIDDPGTLCLGTSYTRSKLNYNENGELQTILHEIPATMNNGQKYICFPLAKEASNNLTQDGKWLLDGIIDYLMTGTAVTPSAFLPTLQINRFVVEGHDVVLTQGEEPTAVLTLSESEYVALDSLRAVKPVITLADPERTHVIVNAKPVEEDKYDLRFTNVIPLSFVVTDYINRLSYSFSLILQKAQGIDEIYEVGQWVNIFDIYGRKVATTNENIYTVDLPRGMYIILTETGQTIKLMR